MIDTREDNEKYDKYIMCVSNNVSLVEKLILTDNNCMLTHSAMYQPCFINKAQLDVLLYILFMKPLFFRWPPLQSVDRIFFPNYQASPSLPLHVKPLLTTTIITMYNHRIHTQCEECKRRKVAPQ